MASLIRPSSVKSKSIKALFLATAVKIVVATALLCVVLSPIAFFDFIHRQKLVEYAGGIMPNRTAIFLKMLLYPLVPGAVFCVVWAKKVYNRPVIFISLCLLLFGAALWQDAFALLKLFHSDYYTPNWWHILLSMLWKGLRNTALFTVAILCVMLPGTAFKRLWCSRG